MDNKNFVTALDLGSSSVAVVVASRGEDGKVHIEDFVISPSEGVVEGEIRNIEQVAKSVTSAIKEIEKRLGIKIAEVYTGISGRHVRSAQNSYYVYIGRDGEICQEDVQRLVDSMNNVQAPEGCKILHMSAQSYLVNDKEEAANPVGMFGNKLDGTFNFILAENEHLSRLERALQRLGIRSRKVLVNALATAMAVTYKDERELGVAVIDLGAGTTDVCIFLGDTLRYVGVIPLGADLINKDLRSYGILERYVEELKVNYGSAMAGAIEGEKRIKIPGYTPGKPQEISFRNLSGIIDARLKDIAKYVVEEIEYAGYGKKLGAGLVLTGGGAGLKDIDKFFAAETGMEVRVASADLCVDEASKEAAADYRLATAVGLASQGFESGATETVGKRSIKVEPDAVEDGPDEAPAGRWGRKDKGRKAERGAANGAADNAAGAANGAGAEGAADGTKQPRQPKEPKQPKKGLFDRFKEMFDTIDDNEI